MTYDWQDLSGRLAGGLERYDRAAVEGIVSEIAAALDAGAEPPERWVADRLKALRKKRHFDLIDALGEKALRAGIKEPGIRLQCAQAFIDRGEPARAVDTLELVSEQARGKPGDAYAEAQGLLGRAYKQLYVDAVARDPGAASVPLVRKQLQLALDAYVGMYRADAKNLWHGINAVAVTRRAAADGVALANRPDPDATAGAVLGEIATQYAAAPDAVQTWDLASGVEACVALGRPDEAMDWALRYVQRPDADAFELGSTVRQLKQVWRLDPAAGVGALVLPVLEARLLQRNGGRVVLLPGDVRAVQQGLEAVTAATSRALERLAPKDRTGFEATFGPQGVKSLGWYLTGLARCAAVGQIRLRVEQEGVGTAFLVRGADLAPALAGEVLLVTNAHVVSPDPAVRQRFEAQHPDDVEVRFEAPGPTATRGGGPWKVRAIWTSPPHPEGKSRPGALDATVLRLEGAPPDGWDAYPLARDLPAGDGKHEVFVIGHPGGKGLAFSLQDNLVIGSDATVVHYRAPTEPGSSGSPVFDAKWNLLGVHHFGDPEMKKFRWLMSYQANEGIVFARIAEAVAAAFANGAPPP